MDRTHTPRVRLGLRTLATALVGGALTFAVLSPVSAQTNGAPIAAGDAATTAEDTSVTVAVLANDSDPDSDSLDVTAVSTAAHGTTTLNASNTITYTPAANYNGTDTFFYTVTDGSLSVPGAVTITITAVNDAPVAVNDTATTSKNNAVAISVLANDSDVDTAKASLLVSAGASPSHGTVTFGTDQKITYTPATDFTGTDTFTYVISDGSLTANATVTVTVKGSSTGSDLNARVVAACQAYTGTDQGIVALCNLYLSNTLPQWAEDIIGKLLLKRIPPVPQPDRVAMACETATNTAVMRLCVLYLDDATPSWLKHSVGKLILRITLGDDDRRSDVRGNKDDNRDGNSGKDKHDKSKDGQQAVSNVADDKTREDFRAWWLAKCDKNGDGVVDEADFSDKRGKSDRGQQAVSDSSDDKDDDDRRSKWKSDDRRGDDRRDDDDRKDRRGFGGGKHRNHR